MKMLETIAGNAKQTETTFLSTPRSMLPGSWVSCDSPRLFVEPPKQPMRLEPAKQDKGLSIEIPKLDEAKPEERDAPENTGIRGVNSTSDSVAGSVAGSVVPPPPAGETPRDSRYECDYDKDPTEIFLELQRKEWQAAAKRANENPVEARTWVSRKEKHGKLRWRLLPIHAAIIFKAPENVIETLLAAYPKGAQSKDDQGMLPLHLAFRHGSTEGTVNLLLVAFPQSVEIKDRKGRIPLVLAQASASPNRDAFVRALERGPTYYANAAAATERAAVTAQQKAIFDAKLIEVEKKHQQDVNILKEEKQGLNETIELLQKELAKQKGATQILVDHVNSLETQLKSKGETERFLAVKAATLDTNLKELCEAKEAQRSALKQEFDAMTAELEEAKKENARLQEELEEAKKEAPEDLNLDEFKFVKDKSQKQEKELKSLKMDWASAQARAAVLEAQLKSKIENEHELASQVSHLAGKLAESAADNSDAANIYAKRVEVLEDEREKLRATVNDLGKKLLKVSNFMNKMTQKSQEKTAKTSEEARQMQAKLLEDASNHEQLIRTALAERKHMAELLKKQEEEMERSAKQHQEILEKLAELKKESSPEASEDDDIPFSDSLTEEMQEMMDGVLRGLPKDVPSEDSDLVDSVVESVCGSATSEEKKIMREVVMKSSRFSIMDRSIDSCSTDIDEDPQKCLEEALRALELSRTKSVSETPIKSLSEVSECTSLNFNPSDEESELKRVVNHHISISSNESD